MNGNKIMAAIGNIDVRFVMEFSEVTPVKKPISALAKRILLISACLCAACLCLVILLTVRWGNQNDGPHIQPPATSQTAPGMTTNPTVPTTAVPPSTQARPVIEVWRSHNSENMFGNYPNAKNGTIILSGSLKYALQTFPGNNYVFPVYVHAASNNDAYTYAFDVLLKPFATDEGFYEQNHTVFMTAEQLATLECAPDFWVALDIAYKEHGTRYITKDNIGEITTATKKVTVGFRAPDDEAGSQQVLDAIFAEYGITKDMVSFGFAMFHRFDAELEVTLIAKMLDDSRIPWIVDPEPITDIWNLFERS